MNGTFKSITKSKDIRLKDIAYVYDILKALDMEYVCLDIADRVKELNLKFNADKKLEL